MALCSVRIVCNRRKTRFSDGDLRRGCMLLLVTGAFAIVHILMCAWPSARQLQHASVFPGKLTSQPKQADPVVQTQFSMMLPTQRGQDSRSRPWAPYVVQKCEPGVPPYFAPCLALQAVERGLCVVSAEELVYPDAELLLPGFLKPEQRSLWLSQREVANSPRLKWIDLASDKAQEYLVLTGGHGQNWVFCNARYTDDPNPGV
jgi:hypothetical protein